MITKTEIEAFEKVLDKSLAGLKAQVMSEVEKLGIKKPDTFLKDLSDPVKLVSDEPEKEPGLPNMDGLTLEDETPELPFLERGGEDWRALVKHLMENNVSEVPQQGKKFQLKAKDWEYMKNLIFYKSELFSGNMDTRQIFAQKVDESDKHFFLEMQHKVNQ